MGYYSRLRGDLRVEPALQWATVKDSVFLRDADDHSTNEHNYLVWYEVEEDSVEVPEGTLVKKYVSDIGVYDDSCKMYDLDDTLTLLGSEVAAAGSRLVGELIREGEESGDIQKYTFREDGTLRVQTARFTFDDAD